MSGIASRLSPLAGWRVSTIHSNPAPHETWTDDDDGDARDDEDADDDDDDVNEEVDAESSSTAHRGEEQTTSCHRKVGRVHHVNADGTGSVGEWESG